MFHLRTLIVCLLATALSISGARAQSAGTVRGVMTDDSGAVVPAANVTLTGAGVNKTAQTQADGTYTFSGVAPGQYHVKATFPGFAPVDMPVTVGAGANLSVPIQLSIATGKQEITVAEAANTAVSVEPDNNATALVLKGDDLAALPDDPSMGSAFARCGQASYISPRARPYSL